jgi:hypothetical protein
MSNKKTPANLIKESQDLLDLAEQIQSETMPLDEPTRKEKHKQLNNLYRSWYRKALSLFSKYNRPELEESFMREYEGSWISQKIKSFLELGWKVYEFYDPEKPNPIIPKWTVSFGRSFKNPLEKQCDYLAILEGGPTIPEIESHSVLASKENEDWNKAFQLILSSINASSIEPKLKEIATYDLNQAQRAYQAGAFKASIVMLGAVLEGIMLGTLRRIDVLEKIRVDIEPPKPIKKLGVNDPQLADKIADNLGFEDYKNAISFLIPEIEKDKVENIQTFRNAVHPWKTVENPTIYAEPDQIRAMSHITSLVILARHILLWIP